MAIWSRPGLAVAEILANRSFFQRGCELGQDAFCRAQKPLTSRRRASGALGATPPIEFHARLFPPAPLIWWERADWVMFSTLGRAREASRRHGSPWIVGEGGGTPHMHESSICNESCFEDYEICFSHAPAREHKAEKPFPECAAHVPPVDLLRGFFPPVNFPRSLRSASWEEPSGCSPRLARLRLGDLWRGRPDRSGSDPRERSRTIGKTLGLWTGGGPSHLRRCSPARRPSSVAERKSRGRGDSDMRGPARDDRRKTEGRFTRPAPTELSASSVELVEALSGPRLTPPMSAAYPRPPPEARGPGADVDWLKRKIDAGAHLGDHPVLSSSPRPFSGSRDALPAAAGIDAPIVPGILPIQNWKSVPRFRRGAAAPAFPEKLVPRLRHRAARRPGVPGKKKKDPLFATAHCAQSLATG